MPRVAPEPARNEVKEEGNLLVEAVSLLVQRQRETESWVAEQVWQAEERVVANERRYDELEARLESLEQQLASLVRNAEPSRGETADDERLARLREQLEGLRSGADGYLPRSPAAMPVGRERPRASVNATPNSDEAMREPPPAREARVGRPVSAASRPRTAAPQSAGILDLMGPTPQERIGFVFIAVGGVAVLYAILSQLRFG